MITGKCKGARDLLPGDMAKFRLIEGRFREACRSRGFEEVRTPVIEYFHLFTSAGTLTPKMLGRVYSFLDWDGWSGERVVLRPEGTIPAARLYLENLPRGSLAKLFYIENMFSFEENGKEAREKWQGGVELIGSSQAAADVELITLALEILESLKIGPVELKLTHIGYMRALLSSFGLPLEKEEKLYENIMDGRPIEEALAEVAEDIKEKEELAALRLLRGKTLRSLGNLQALSKLPSEVKRHLENFYQIGSLIQALGSKFSLDFSCGGRGLEYYTGIYYRLSIKKVEVGGGGRYDNLVNQNRGGPVPASGFALYLDRLVGLLPEKEFESLANHISLISASQDNASLLDEMKAARALRERGLKVELGLSPQQVGKNRWLLKSPGGDGKYHLKDNLVKKQWELSSLEKVLKKLEALCK